MANGKWPVGSYPLLAISLFPFFLNARLVDTIGFTDRDRQFLFPSSRYLVFDTARGLHAIYKTGYGEIRYNFCPKGGTWRFPDGVCINPFPRNLGCLDYNIRTGQALVSADHLNRGKRTVTYFIDSAPGTARFRELPVATGFEFPAVAAARYGYPKLSAIANDTIYYISPFSRYRLGKIGPFARHTLVASKNSSRLGFIWADDQGDLFLRETPDGGGTWYPLQRISDGVPSDCNRALFGAQAVYDSTQIHIVADLYDGRDRGRVQLWHYCPADTPAWRFIREFTFPDTLRLGTYTAALCRPSIGIDRRKLNSDLNHLYVVWEQFDPENIDPTTGIARADIWGSYSPDNGKTWTQPVRLTTPDETSKRFPFLAETVTDTLHIIYFADRTAGSWELGEGGKTQNPVIHLRVPADIFRTSFPIPHSQFPIRHLRGIPGRDGLSSSPIPPSQFPIRHLRGVYNPLGQKIRTADLATLPAGVYFIFLSPPLRGGDTGEVEGCPDLRPSAKARFQRVRKVR